MIIKELKSFALKHNIFIKRSNKDSHKKNEPDNVTDESNTGAKAEDRSVLRQPIRTSYHKSALESVNSAFDNKKGNYLHKKRALEVPKDQFNEAVRIMANKISECKVPGVFDVNMAREMIKQGDLTYRQAKNIAIAGNIDSIMFDVRSQAVSSLSSLGISFGIKYAFCIWEGMSQQDALKISAVSGLRSGIVVLGVGTITSQLLRTSLGRRFIAFSSKISDNMIRQLYRSGTGNKAIRKFSKTVWGKSLSGAATKGALKNILRSNLISTTLTTTIITLPDFYKALISKRISWNQFNKNLAANVGGVAGGAGGAIVGATIGSLIAPGAGTAIGSVIGGIAGDIGGGMGTKRILDRFSDDDAKKMYQIMIEVILDLSESYMITENEYKDYLEGALTEMVTPKWLEKMYQVRLHRMYAYEQLEPFFKQILAQRPVIEIPSSKVVNRVVRRSYFFILTEYVKGFFGRQKDDQ